MVGSIWNRSHCIKLNVADRDTKWEELTEGVIGVRVVGIALHSRPLPHHTVPADDTVQHAAVLLGREGRGGEGREDVPLNNEIAICRPPPSQGGLPTPHLQLCPVQDDAPPHPDPWPYHDTSANVHVGSEDCRGVDLCTGVHLDVTWGRRTGRHCTSQH